MSDDMYEVAFSGEIIEGADIEDVKLAVAKLFKADDAKLEQLFSGKRIVIKKNIDLNTANKYQSALNKAQAVCELKNVSVIITEEIKIEAVPVAETSEPPAASENTSSVSKTAVPAAPNTTPLNIDAEKINDLSADIAPIGSDLQDQQQAVADFAVDLDGLSIAPVGSDLSEKKEPVPKAVLDTSDLSLI